MQRVAFDLRRPALVAFDEQPGRDAAERHRGREEERPAGDDLLGLPDVRDDLFGRLARARGDAGERERRAHQLQERSPRDRIGDRFDLRGELVVAAARETRDRRRARRACASQGRDSVVIGGTSSSS